MDNNFVWIASKFGGLLQDLRRNICQVLKKALNLPFIIDKNAKISVEYAPKSLLNNI